MTLWDLNTFPFARDVCLASRRNSVYHPTIHSQALYLVNSLGGLSSNLELSNHPTNIITANPMATNESGDWIAHLCECLRYARRIDALRHRLNIRDDSFAGQALTQMKKTIVDGFLKNLPKNSRFTAVTVRQLFDNEGRPNAPRDEVVAALSSIHLDDKVHSMTPTAIVSQLRDSVADIGSKYAVTSTTYHLLSDEAEFLLVLAGYVSPGANSWMSRMLIGGTSLFKATLPAVLGFFNAGAGVGAGLHLLSGSMANGGGNGANAPNEEQKRAAAFFAMAQGLYQGEVDKLTSGQRPIDGWAENVHLLRDRIDAVDRQIVVNIRLNQESRWIRLFQRRQRLLVGLLSAIGNIKTCRQFEASEGDEPKTPPPEIQDLLDEYTNLADLDILIWLVQINCATTNAKRLNIYSHGPYGTGKTRFADRLSRAVDLPLSSISITSAEDLVCLLPRAQTYDSMDRLWAEDQATDAMLCGSILYAVLTSGCINTIIHIDEASALMSGNVTSQYSSFSVTDGLKLLFDDTKRFFPASSIATGFQFNCSSLTIIVSSNKSLEEQRIDPALRSRLRSFYFGPMTRQVRITAATNRLGEYKDDKLPKYVLLKLRNQTSRYIEIIVDRSMAKDHSGAREIMNAIWATWALALHAHKCGLPDVDERLAMRSIELHIPKAYGNASENGKGRIRACHQPLN